MSFSVEKGSNAWYLCEHLYSLGYTRHDSKNGRGFSLTKKGPDNTKLVVFPGGCKFYFLDYLTGNLTEKDIEVTVNG